MTATAIARSFNAYAVCNLSENTQPSAELRFFLGGQLLLIQLMPTCFNRGSSVDRRRLYRSLFDS